MGRRSDHSRAELAELILAEGHRQMAEVGFSRFSAREVAKRIGYSIGTLYNVFGSLDRLLAAINTRTFGLWARHLEARLENEQGDRIAALVDGYFSFARENANLWMAIYDHRLPPDVSLAADDHEARSVLTEIVTREVAASLPKAARAGAPRLARSLVATVHGHCTFALNGAFDLMGEAAPQDLALARVRESLAAAS
ncbi:TetR/AcrR family transcriptional regulator [Sphingosinicella sp. BN140058]|uniref:TetR/AcrR family transcriptional regulator n=1 Tax=Sphingosinicella sp. BN140058 TaxID=1892855 RepID=UPI0010133CD5|nr:TetR/AcrR family transcriptional regulator [Sphingosinicella sp. BN140058]QAY75446.1 TetR/AcrR family transcriptional regulator [Sphingosinicella sp. BN140058]